MKRLACALFILLSGAVFAQPTIVNPVLAHDFADPTVMLFGDTYYAYATNSKSSGKYVRLQVATSKDLVHWQDQPDGMPDGATWANGNYWAPHVLYDGQLKKYILYFSAQSAIDTLGKCLGVAFADRPEGPFVDKGLSLATGKGYINIDPFAFTDPKSGKKLLYWGSNHQPIHVQEMTDDWASFKPGSVKQPVIYPGEEKPYGMLAEGAWVDYNDGYYYVYYSGNNCCGPTANYAVMVSRSKSAFGPFERLAVSRKTPTSAVLEENDQWEAPGHNSVVRDKKGNIYMVYHAIDKSKKLAGRVLLISPMRYKNGWPVVDYPH